MKTSPVGLAALLAGCGLTVVGLGLYQAWWTVVFGIGGFATAMLVQERGAPIRAIAIGASIAGSILLIGMGLFLLSWSMRGPSRPCAECADSGPGLLVASIAAIGVGIALVVVARRLLRTSVRYAEAPRIG